MASKQLEQKRKPRQKATLLTRAAKLIDKTVNGSVPTLNELEAWRRDYRAQQEALPDMEQMVRFAKRLFDAIGEQEPKHNINWETGLAVSQWLTNYDKLLKD